MNEELGPVARFLKKQANSVIRRLTGRKTYFDAQQYTSTDEVSGQRQTDLLVREGCGSSSYVLEIGCGCLSAGLHLIRLLEAGHYVGIDPNEWLRETTLRRREAQELVALKTPTFLSNLEFDASSTGLKFDFVLSHSILSHAAHWQLPLYLEKVSAVLAPKGKVFASLYLSEGNDVGNIGTPDRKDSMDEEWVYPGVSWFTHETIQKVASDFGLKATHRADLTTYFVAIRPGECHDWFEFSLAD